MRTILINVQQRATGKLPSGQPNGGWTTYKALWAQVQGVSGLAAIRAAEQGLALAPARYSFKLTGYRTDITDAMRVEYKGTIFDIRQVRHNFAEKRGTMLICETGGSNG